MAPMPVTPTSLANHLLVALPSLIDDGLVSFDGTRLAVTEQGHPLVRSVCAAFDRHYTGGEGRHARAI